MLYRFRCWEQHDAEYQPSLVASCRTTGRLAFFDTYGDLQFDITSMATTRYEAEGQPLIALALASEAKLVSIYAPLNELADGIAALQDDALWRMLCMTTRSLPEKHRLA